MIAVAETLHHFGGRLLAGKIQEVLLDVLNLERPLLQAVLFDQIFVHRRFELYRAVARSEFPNGQIPIPNRQPPTPKSQISKSFGSWQLEVGFYSEFGSSKLGL